MIGQNILVARYSIYYRKVLKVRTTLITKFLGARKDKMLVLQDRTKYTGCQINFLLRINIFSTVLENSKKIFRIPIIAVHALDRR